MNKTGVLIGIDAGNTNLKCVAIEPNGRCVKLVRMPAGESRFSDDADRLFADICRILQETVASLPAGCDVLGVAVSSGGCSAFCTAGNGKQIPFERPGSFVVPDDCTDATGYPPQYHNSGIVLMNTVSDLSRVAHVFSYSDYIAYRLCGEVGREISTAGSMSMYDRRTGGWWDAFKSATGFTDDVLGVVCSSGTKIGEITAEAVALTGLAQGVPVCSGGHDYLCAAFALGCVDEGNLLNVLGTYEMVTSFYRNRVTYPAGIQAFSDCHCYPGRYSLTCETLGGAQLEWLRSILPGGDRPDFWNRMYDQIDSLPDAFTGGENELLIPRIYGECFPVSDPSLCGGFVGLTSKTDPGRMLRAAIIGLSMYSKRMLDFAGLENVSFITAAGGGSQGRFWMQTKADFLGLPVIVPHVPEASATGAALLAGIGAGVYCGHDEACKIYVDTTKTEYLPNTERGKKYINIYDEVFLPALDYQSAPE